MLTVKQKEEIINLVFEDYDVKEEYIQLKKENNNTIHFIIEDETNFIFVEYKNSAVSGASAPNAFQPSQDTSVKKIARKFYDSLHYLRLIAQEGGKSLDYVYILEYPNGDSITRKLIRDKIAKYLPFAIQNAIQKKHSSTKTIIVFWLNIY